MNVIGMQGIVGGSTFSVSPSSSYSPFNNGGGTKRPLASCREDLERSWQTLTSSPTTSSASMNQEHYLRLVSHNGNSGIVEESDDDMIVHGRTKRRRTGLASSSIIADDCMDAADGAPPDATMGAANPGEGFCKDVRISPDNRPPFAMIVAPTARSNSSSASSSAMNTNRPPIKAGWYTGSLSVNGHRHGHGTTKHDDGTSYTGPYVNDHMHGYGTYTFTTTRHLVPNPKMNGNSLHRVIEKSFEGNFSNGAPLGKGTVVTKSVDSLPVCGNDFGWASQNYTVPSNIQHVEVVHDVGMHNSDGAAVGEGVRVMYLASYTDKGSVLEQECFRLLNGNITMKVAFDYASWVCSCMGMEVPGPPSTTLSDDVGMISR
mmetsp:Transcript_5531/g.9348  ORF Transcript_5531/g.9348 Transcript_5531/m.9348 type:complete len:374 (+) Transcript_5531:294-1415(+)|eukprot:scaffold124_cov153-Skeletonema_menzelii.AAC.9